MGKFTSMLEKSIKELHTNVGAVMILAGDVRLGNPETHPSEAAKVLVVLTAKADEL